MDMLVNLRESLLYVVSFERMLFPVDGFFSGYQLAETDIVGTVFIVVHSLTCIYGGRDERIDKLGTLGDSVFFGQGVPK